MQSAMSKQFLFMSVRKSADPDAKQEMITNTNHCVQKKNNLIKIIISLPRYTDTRKIEAQEVRVMYGQYCMENQRILIEHV